MKILFFISIIILSAVCLNAQVKAPAIGIVNTLDHDSILFSAGYRHIITSISSYVSPRTVTDEQFQTNLLLFKKLGVKLYAFNIFLPGDLKVVGPSIDEPSILKYSETVFQRTKQAGVKMIVWGSGGSRRLPEGYDKAKAKSEFIAIARKLAALAKKYEITLALESLNSSETNFINTAAEAYEIIKTVDHPNLRLNIDIYHMQRENESPDIIAKAKDYIVHCELAEKEGRSAPGTEATDFRPWLAALKKSGYRGDIFLECNWKDLALEAPKSFQFLTAQIRDVYQD